MKTIVIYKTLSWFTKKYAERIAKDIKADLFDIKEISLDSLKKYDCIIFWWGLHAATINGLGKIKNHLLALSDKYIIVFATGAWPDRPNVLEEVKNKNFTKEQQKKIKFFYFRWGFDFNKLDIPNKIIMTIFKWVISLKKEKTPDEIGMIDSYKNPVDFTKQENIKEMVSYIKKLS